MSDEKHNIKSPRRGTRGKETTDVKFGEKKTGRPAGQPNIMSRDTKQWLADFLNDNETRSGFIEAYGKIADPYHKCVVWLEASKRILPTLKSVDFQLEEKVVSKTKKLLNDLADTD